MTGFDAIVLAGGRGSRLGGTDKGALRYAGSTLLDRTLAAVSAARTRVVVGGVPRHGALHVVEDPPFGGPAAAVAAGLSAIAATAEPAAYVVVVPCDVPRIDQAVARLLNALDHSDPDRGTIAVDASGREQYVVAAYPQAALREATTGTDGVAGATGGSMRALVSGLRLRPVELGDLARDVDTPEDAAYFGIDPT